jgi:hypothetical protein
MSEDWCFGYQASDNELTLYIELFPFPDTKLVSGSKKPLNENLVYEAKLKPIRKIKKLVAVLS